MALFEPSTLADEKFFKICVLSQCIVYCIHFQNIHTFTYQKTLLYTLLLRVSKIVKAFTVSLNMKQGWYKLRSNVTKNCY